MPFWSRKPVPLGTFPSGDAVSLGGYSGDPWVRLFDGSGLMLRILHHADVLPEGPLVRFNIWGDPAAGFFSPEPWVGTQNSLNSRQGLIELEPGATWTWIVRLDVQTDG